jgi:hypothetical protein
MTGVLIRRGHWDGGPHKEKILKTEKAVIYKPKIEALRRN